MYTCAHAMFVVGRGGSAAAVARPLPSPHARNMPARRSGRSGHSVCPCRHPRHPASLQPCGDTVVFVQLVRVGVPILACSGPIVP